MKFASKAQVQISTGKKESANVHIDQMRLYSLRNGKIIDWEKINIV